MWQSEMVVVLVTLGGLVAFHYVNKLLSAPGSIIFTCIFALCLVGVILLSYGVRFFGHVPISNRAIVFLALYAWCVCAMLFFAAKQTHYFKLMLGLASQAGILYALFIWL